MRKQSLKINLVAHSSTGLCVIFGFNIKHAAFATCFALTRLVRLFGEFFFFLAHG